jgi:putative transposase
LARWAQEAYRISERHAAKLVQLAISTLRYRSRKVFDEVLRRRLRELAGTHVRYGYRRLTVLLRREGWHVNAKRIYRLYREEELIVRSKQRRKMARRQRIVTTAVATRPNQRLRDECLNVEWFASLDDARQKLAKVREHYNHERPLSSLADLAPAAFAQQTTALRSPTAPYEPQFAPPFESRLFEALEHAKLA